MSEVLDYVREKDPRFKDVSDDDLTLFIGSKKPDFLKDPGFKEQFEKVAGSKIATGIALGTGFTGTIQKVLAAGAEGSQMGREQLQEMRGGIQAGIDLGMGMTGKVEKLLESGAPGSVAGREQLGFIRQGIMAGSGGAMPEERSAFEGLSPSRSLSKARAAFAPLAGQAVTEGLTAPLAEIMPKVSSADLEKLLGFMAPGMPYAMARERAKDATPEERANEPGMHPEQMLTPEAKRLMQAVAGLEQSAADQVNFFSSPLGIATLGMGELPPLLAKLVGTAFTLQMAHSLPKIAKELGTELGKPEEERDYEKIYKLSGDAVATLGFTAAGGLHTMEPVIRSARGYLAYRKAIKEAFPVAPFTATALDNTVGTQYTGAGPLSPPVRLPEGPKEPPATAGTAETAKPKEKGPSDERPEDQKQAAGEVSTVQGKPAEQQAKGQAERGTPLREGEDQGQLKAETPGQKIDRVSKATPEDFNKHAEEVRKSGISMQKDAHVTGASITDAADLEKIRTAKANLNREIRQVRKDAQKALEARNAEEGQKLFQKMGDLGFKRQWLNEVLEGAFGHSDPTKAGMIEKDLEGKPIPFPNQPPEAPHDVDFENFDQYQEALHKYRQELSDWEAKQPKNKPLIFQHDNRVVAITPDFADPKYPWRATSFSNTDHAPIGHEVYGTRAEAVRAQHDSTLIDKIPFQVEPLPIRAFPGDKVTWRRPGAEPIEVKFAGYSKEPGKALIKDPETGETISVDSMEVGPKMKTAAQQVQIDIVRDQITALENKVLREGKPLELAKLQSDATKAQLSDEEYLEKLKQWKPEAQTPTTAEIHKSIYDKLKDPNSEQRVAVEEMLAVNNAHKAGKKTLEGDSLDSRRNNAIDGLLEAGFSQREVNSLMSVSGKIEDTVNFYKPIGEAAEAPKGVEGFTPVPVPEKFETIADISAYRDKVKQSYLDFFKSLGMTDAEAARFFKAYDMRSNVDVSDLYDKLSPENKAKVDAFDRGEGEKEVYDFDRRYDPSQLEGDWDNEDLSREIVLGLTRAGEDLPNRFGDHLAYVSAALLRLKEAGGTWSDIARALDRYTTEISGSQGDKAEVFKMYGERIRQFAGRQGVDLPQGELGAKVGTPEAPKALNAPESGKPLKRRIKQNIWGNWNGYEGNKKVQEFGTDEQAAKEWFEAGPKEQRSPTAINRDIKKTKANIRALRSAKRSYEKAKDKGAAARVQEKIQEAENKLTQFNQELSQLGTIEDKRVGQAMRRFNRETQENGPDILSEIAEKRKIMSWSQFVEAAKTKGKEWFEQNKSEYDDIRNVKLPPHINAAIYGGDALPNVAASALLGEGKTASDLWAEVKKASDTRLGLAEGKGGETKALLQEEQQQVWKEATGPKEGRTEVDPSIVAPGEVYVVDGQELRVTAKDPNTGNLTIDGGKKFGEMIVRETEPFWVDEVKEVHEGEADFLPPEDQEPKPAAEAPKAPEAPKKPTGGELFASEDIPFNLTGEKATGAAPEKPKTEAAAQGDLLGGEAPKKEEPAFDKPKVEERPLTEAEKEEFLDLSKKLRANREEGGPALTTEETQRYEYLTALAGQKDFGFAEPTGPEAIKGKIKALASQIQRLDDAMPKGSGKAKKQYLEQRQKLHQEMRDLMDKLTEGQGETVYTSDPKEMPNGYFARREFRVRQLSDEEVQDRWRDPASRMEVFKVAGTRPYVAESRRIDFDDANATQEAGKGNWYADGYGKTRDAAIGDARGRKGSTWSKIPEEALSAKPAEPAPESTTPITEQKFRVGNNPTTYTLLERLDQTPVEKENNEQPVRVRNDNTGKEEILMEGDLTPVKAKSAAEKAKAKGEKRDLDKELRELGLDPSVFKNKAEKQAAIIRENQKKQGPGTPHITQPPDPKANIEQLEESFRNIRGRIVPLLERVKAMFSMGERIAAAKDFITEATAGLKVTGDYLISKFEGYAQLDDLLRAKGELSAEIEKNGWRMKHFVNTILKNVPDPMQRAAIAKWVDAGGDMEKLIAGYEEAPDKYKQHYLDAMDLSGDLLIGAMNIRNFFDSRLQEAIDAGVLKQGVEDYIHRMYEKTPALEQKMLNYVQTGLLRTNPALAKKRFFDHDWEAERAGYNVVQDFLPRIVEYEASLSRAIASRKFVRKIIGYEDAAGNKIPPMLAPDGRPVIDVAGLGVPITDEEGVREGSLIKPSFKPPAKTVTNIQPDTGLVETYEDPLTKRDDYVARNQYPVFRKWKWAVNDSAGNPIYVQGDVIIHPDYVARFDKLLEPSRIRYARSPVLRAIGRGALGAGSFVKQSMLDLSGFHQVQMAIHGAEHRVYTLPGEVPVGLKQLGFEKILQDIDLNDPRVDGLLQGGLTLGGDYRYGSEGLVGKGLTRWVPGLNQAMSAYHTWLFQDFIPRLKTTMALSALDRNLEVFKKDLASGKRTMEDVYNITANEANAAFGELNQITLERSKTMQDALRLIFLAPDFLEARGRFAAQAATKYGAEQRWALAYGAIGMWGFARIMNLVLDGQMHNEPENLFSVVYKGRAYGLRTVQGDILHLLTHPVQFWMSRLNPLFGRTFLEAASGRDYFGRKRSALEQVWDAVSTVEPASIRHTQEHLLWESMLNAFGVTSRRFSDVDDAFKLAQKWKDKHGVGMKGEFIYDPNKDPLRGLKIALSNDDEARSVKEIQKLVESKKWTLSKLDDYFSKYADMPLAGSASNDRKFIQTLSADQKKTVQGAIQHKKAIRKLFLQAKGKYNAAIHGPAPKADAELDEPTPQVQ